MRGENFGSFTGGAGGGGAVGVVVVGIEISAVYPTVWDIGFSGGLKAS